MYVSYLVPLSRDLDILGDIHGRRFLVIFKAEDGTVKLHSECVGTQGWLSHKMLPLAGKRGMVWCGRGMVWYRYGMTDVWCDIGLVWLRYGVVSVWCGRCMVWYRYGMAEVWYGSGMVEVCLRFVMVCHIKCCHCQGNILPFSALFWAQLCFC